MPPPPPPPPPVPHASAARLSKHSHISQCSGHPCIPGQRQQEEGVHLKDHRTMEVEAAVKAMVIKAVNMDHHQEEELVRRRSWVRRRHRTRRDQDHLHQEEDMEELAQRQGALHHSRQEEPAIQETLQLPLHVYHSLNVIQIHGVHLIDPGNLSQS